MKFKPFFIFICQVFSFTVSAEGQDVVAQQKSSSSLKTSIVMGAEFHRAKNDRERYGQRINTISEARFEKKARKPKGMKVIN